MTRRHRQPEPGEGATRTVRRLLLLPRRLKGEWRWLEWANIEQVRRRLHHLLPDDGPVQATFLKWVNVAWGDTPPKESKQK